MSNEEIRETWQRFWRQNKDKEVSLDGMSRVILAELIKNGGGLKGKRILEAGCGRGIISVETAALGAEVYLLDIAADALEIAKNCFASKNQPAVFIHGDIVSLPFEESSFDVVWNAGVLEHFEGGLRQKAIDGMARILKPGGIFISFNPHERALFYNIGKKAAEKKGIWPYGPEFPVESLKEGCEAAGLAVIKEYPICFRENLSYLSYVSKHLRSIVKLTLLPFPDNFLIKIFGGYLLVTIGVKQER